MSCLTQGFTLDCNASRCTGGIARILLGGFEDISSFTTAGTDGAIDTITRVTGTQFFEVDFYEQTAVINSNGTQTNRNTSFEQTLEFAIPCRDQVLRNFIQELADCSCGLAIVVQENTGNSFAYGFLDTANGLITTPVRLSTTAGTSGQAFTDNNEEIITLLATSNYKELQIDSTLSIDTLLVAAP